MQPSAPYPAQHGYPVDSKQPYPPPQPMMQQAQYPPGNYPQQYPYQQPPPPQVYGVDTTSPPPYATTIAPQPTYPVAQVLREWHRDICGCFNDVPFCLLTMVLPCISECIVAKKAKLQQILIALIFLYFGFFGTSFLEGCLLAVFGEETGESFQIPTESPFYLPSQFLSVINGIIGLIIFAFLVSMRIKIRESRNIVGTSLGDCCWIFWCTSCATCQQYEELKFAEEDDTVQRC